jgi:hypothetical protein
MMMQTVRKSRSRKVSGYIRVGTGARCHTERAGLFLRAPMVGPHSLPAEIFDQSVWQPLTE